MAANPQNYLLIVNDAPYGNERPYNALRLALNLVKRPEIGVRVFLMGDGVTCAVTRSEDPRRLLQRRAHAAVHRAARRSRHLRLVLTGSRARARPG